MRAVVCFVACIAAGCAKPPPSRALEATPVPVGAVAACAGAAFSASVVASVASAEQVAPARAVERLAYDARLARAARDRALEDLPRPHAAIRAALARALLAELKHATSTEPPTADELDKVRREHWAELDRPEASKVIHAIAVVRSDADQATKDRARAVAEAIARATRGSTSEADFRQRATAVPHEGVEVRVETLPPVAADGRIVQPGGGALDPTFAAAAAALREPNDEAGTVESPFGFHVIHLLERTPARRVPPDELAKVARDEVFAGRARAEVDRLEKTLRAREGVSVERNADELLRALDDTESGVRRATR